MGFDPRQWPAAGSPPRRVTTNVDALLAENEALRRELHQLRRRLEQLERPARTARRTPASDAPPPPPLRVTLEQVQRWGEALAAQSGWRELRLGGEGCGLQGVIDDLNQRSFHPGMSLEQRLDRLAPGLGRDLLQALGAGAPNRKRLAILAAFALYGLSAIEWLDDDPRRVVMELRQRQQRLEHAGSQRRRSRRTSSDQRDAQQRTSRQQGQSASQAPKVDPRHLAALRVLGLEWGASRQAIKTAHRRLVKQHHPDLGGRAEDFQRIHDAYQLLVA